MVCEHTASSKHADLASDQLVGHYVACAWCGEGCTALSIALVDSIVSSRVGAPHESNRCTPAQRIMHLRAVSARAPVATASRTPANLRYACRCTGVDLCVLAFALTVSSGHDWMRNPRVCGELRACSSELLCVDDGAAFRFAREDAWA